MNKVLKCNSFPDQLKCCKDKDKCVNCCLGIERLNGISESFLWNQRVVHFLDSFFLLLNYVSKNLKSDRVNNSIDRNGYETGMNKKLEESSII